MSTCKDIAEVATDYLEDALAPPARREVEAHLAGCSGCRALLDQLRLTVRLAGSLAPPALTPEARAALLRRFEAWRAPAVAVARPEARAGGRRAGWRTGLALLAVGGLGAALVAGAARPSVAGLDWAIAGALAALAAGLAALADRLTARVALVVSAALAAALLGGGAGGWHLPQGVDCLLTEGAAALGLAGLALVVARRVAIPLDVGVWAVAGALAGDAALQITCAAHASLAHLALFHAGGVAAVMAIAAGLTRRAAARA